MVFHGTRLVFHRAERRRREARHETYITPKLVTTRRSLLGPPAEGRPGPSNDNDDDNDNCDDNDNVDNNLNFGTSSSPLEPLPARKTQAETRPWAADEMFF